MNFLLLQHVDCVFTVRRKILLFLETLVTVLEKKVQIFQIFLILTLQCKM